MKARSPIFRNRQQAARELAGKLKPRIANDAVAIGLDQGGMCIAGEISSKLSIPLEFIPCHAIRHPAKDKVFVGSMCDQEIFLHDFSRGVFETLPVQLEKLQRTIDAEYLNFYQVKRELDVRYKTVIVCADVVRDADALMACLHRIHRDNPFKVILAVAVIATHASVALAESVDEIVVLQEAGDAFDATAFIASLPSVSDSRIRSLLHRACGDNNFRKQSGLHSTFV